MAQKTGAREVAQKMKHDEPDKKIPIKDYSNYIKDADAPPVRGGQERRT